MMTMMVRMGGNMAVWSNNMTALGIDVTTIVTDDQTGWRVDDGTIWSNVVVGVSISERSVIMVAVVGVVSMMGRVSVVVIVAVVGRVSMGVRIVVGRVSMGVRIMVSRVSMVGRVSVSMASNFTAGSDNMSCLGIDVTTIVTDDQTRWGVDDGSVWSNILIRVSISERSVVMVTVVFVDVGRVSMSVRIVVGGVSMMGRMSLMGRMSVMGRVSVMGGVSMMGRMSLVGRVSVIGRVSMVGNVSVAVMVIMMVVVNLAITVQVKRIRYAITVLIIMVLIII
ncbi:unnamed protein product [Owenia fusiformis]|uniref:Uncharacterized protein n=1 Tax=Owenia fusiformis TaxID=6347 RepID=A0A8J1TFF9_OWEFU|nr:unnamed protein product [Owenia fusiformis]